jgi:hypothetical protein
MANVIQHPVETGCLAALEMQHQVGNTILAKRPDERKRQMQIQGRHATRSRRSAREIFGYFTKAPANAR